MAWRKNDPNLTNDPTYLEPRITDVERIVYEQEHHEATFQHGLNILNSTQSGPLKVEFYGNHLVNRIPNFNSGLWSLNANVTVDSDKKITLNATENGEYSRIFINGIKANQPYLIKIKHNGKISVNANDSNSAYISTIQSYTTSQYVKFTTPSNTAELVVYLNNESLGSGTFTFEDVRLYEISSETYDKIGVSLLDSDVERMFPYVDSIKGVKNPVLSVNSGNLFDEQLELGNISSGSNVSSTTDIRSVNHIQLMSGQEYTLHGFTVTDWIALFVYDENKNHIATETANANSITFTMPMNGKYIRFRQSNNTNTNEKLMLNFGSEKVPYSSHNPSYLYAETTLYGNDDKKDILYRNADLSRWEKQKNWETKALDGSLNWTYYVDKTGNKVVRIVDYVPDNYVADGNVIVEKYDGSILGNKDPYANDIADQSVIYTSSGYLLVSISDSDSGWLESQSITANMIKAYFNGWKYTGDGTTHSWVSIVDGTTAPATQSEAFVADPANSPSSYENYFLLYQLAESVVVPLDNGEVEGDLSIQGDAQIEVTSGLIRENVTVSQANDGTWVINEKGIWSSPDNPLNNKVEKIVKILDSKGNDTTKTWTFSNSGSTNGEWAYKKDENIEPNSVFEVYYYPTNKYEFTTNLNNVVAHYNNSMKSSFQQVVAKQSDIATEVSIHDRQILDLMIRLDAGGL